MFSTADSHKTLKTKKYVQAIYEEYLQMDLKKRKENYKIGLYYVVFVFYFLYSAY